MKYLFNTKDAHVVGLHELQQKHNSLRSLYDNLIKGRSQALEELLIANKELAYQIEEKEKLMAELIAANKELTFQNEERERLRIAKEKAEESNRLKTAFLANMSHEIRTPMNGILGFAELLENCTLSEEERKKYIGIIEKSGERLLNIINDVIDISKIEAGLMGANIAESNINEIINTVYTFLKLEAEDKGINISVTNSLPSKEAIIRTDREKLYAILTNLVKNAIKFTSEGSIEFGYKKKGKYLEFFVKDTGSGIPKDKQDAIFERFIQADTCDSRSFQGSGLGLAISRAYVVMLGGKIWVESEEGIGSIFYFTLPYSLEKIESLKTLIAEDNEISEMLITIKVEDYCRTILIARSGAEAVQICRDNPDIDLILMDILMPEMCGYEATRQIRQFNKDVIIIAQTAYALSDDRIKAIEAGCNDYISKPIFTDELHALIKKYFK